MKYFLQAVKEAGRHWPPLVAAFCCSLCVAALWSANIAALFPIIETTLSGKSPQQWNLEQLVNAEQSLAEHRAELAKLEAKIANAPDDERQQLTLESGAIQAKIDVAQAAMASAVWTRDCVTKWLPNQPFQTVLAVVCLVLIGTTLRVSFMLCNAVLVAWVSQSVARDIRGRVFSKALDLDARNFDAYGISGIQAQITHTTELLTNGITSFFSGAVTEPLRIISCLFVAMCISWRLTLASLIFAPIAAFLVMGLNRRVRALATRILDRSLTFHHIALDVLGAHQVVQSNLMEDFERARFNEATGEMRKIALLARFYEALASPLTELLGMGMLCTGLMTSSYLVINQETTIFGITMTAAPLSVSAVTVFLGMLIGAADPLRKLSRVVSGINSGMAAANILYPLLELDPAIADPESPRARPTPFKKLELRDVSFSYDGVNQVIRNADLVIEAGERLAIVGHNGSGKSTLVGLFCRFYDPQQGDILVNGCTMRLFNVEDVRSLFAVVSQKTELFNETVLHNIRYGRWDASEEEVIEAAKKARAHEFIMETPDGYQTVVGSNGHRLSGGQRQRVALARAFLRDSEVLILDEATSQIDVDSERLIHEALAEHARDRTIIFITHRESTLSLASRIVRMESGAAVEVKRDALAA